MRFQAGTKWFGNDDRSGRVAKSERPAPAADCIPRPTCLSLASSTSFERREGAGNAGCFSRTHSLMYEWTRYMSAVITGPSKHRHSLRNGVNACFAPSPVSMTLLVTVALGFVIRGLSTSPVAPGPHAFVVRINTVRPCKGLHAARSVHCIPRSTFGDDWPNAPLHRGRTRRV